MKFAKQQRLKAYPKWLDDSVLLDYKAGKDIIKRTMVRFC